MIAEALYPYPRGLVIATKGGLVRPNRWSWVEDGRPGHLRRALGGSLQRLWLERIDLYQLHAPDPKVPFTESVGALAELQREGKANRGDRPLTARSGLSRTRPHRCNLDHCNSIMGVRINN
jgi:aryl-alcohol dehydrogenase-like predicted oxidoreductase